MAPQTITVDLGPRSYAIHIGAGLLANTGMYAPALGGGKTLIVSNTTIAPLYMNQVATALASYKPEQLILDDGEAYKTAQTIQGIYDKLMAGHFGRDATLVALGGGVVGDMTGFAAATYQRGVDFIQLPTTLLAQVDSSVGGKTGVNHPRGKNMIGAFHQPRLVLADTAVLATLPDRELAAGLAEVIKYGLIRDPDFFDWLEASMPRLLAREPQALAHAIAVSCKNKAAVVAADEREAGQRALLNLGHTFGHALEAALGYGHWLHGEAVAVGMCMSADLSVRLGMLSTTQHKRITTLIAQAGLPTQLPAGLARQQLLELMASDKKVLAGKLRLILLQSIGAAVIRDDCAPALLDATLDGFLVPANAQH